jgi:hypothetical protein
MNRKPICHISLRILIQGMVAHPIERKSIFLLLDIIQCDQLKNKSSRRVTYGNPCYSIGSKANSIYFLNYRLVLGK